LDFLASNLYTEEGITMYKKYLNLTMLIFGFIAQISSADSDEFKSSSKGEDG